MVKAPCGECPDKGCGKHSECEKYKAFQEENEKRKKHHRDWLKVNQFVTEGVMKTRHKTGKDRKR